MRRPTQVSFFLLLCHFLLCLAAEEKQDSPTVVAHLTDADFDASVRGGREIPWFVKFYAPWCGHCKAFAPKWEEMAKRMEGKLKFASVDCMAAKRIAEDYDVTAFPTLKIIADGQVYKFTGKRTEDALEDFMTGGYRVLASEPLPEDRPTSAKIWRRIYSMFWTYGFPLIGFILVTGSFLFCWCYDEEEALAGVRGDSPTTAATSGMREDTQQAKTNYNKNSSNNNSNNSNEDNNNNSTEDAPKTEPEKSAEEKKDE